MGIAVCRWCLWALVLLPACLAQRYRVEMDSASAEGLMLQQILHEPVESQKLFLLEELFARFPKSRSLAWAYDQMRDIYAGRKDTAKVVDLCEKILTVDPLDIHSAHQLLQIAEASKDPAQVTRRMELVARVAAQVLKAAAPQDPAGAEEWKARVSLAAQAAAYVDYLHYTRILQTPDPKAKITLMDEFLQRRPQSPYLPQLLPLYVATYQKLGDNKRAYAVAEHMLQRDPTNEDLLGMLAEGYFQSKGAADKVLAYCGRIAAVLGGKPKPEGVSEADWNKKKTALLGSAHWMAGTTYLNQERYGHADRELRQALPHVRATPQVLGATLFSLGWANYKMQNAAEALRFSKECLAVKSSYHGLCTRNVSVIKAEFNLPD